MRKSGILLHVTSLPSPYGIGTIGKSAHDFVDFLKAAGKKCWQMLPINPTGYGDSPYQALSTYAGNHYLIDLDILKEAVQDRSNNYTRFICISKKMNMRRSENRPSSK